MAQLAYAVLSMATGYAALVKCFLHAHLCNFAEAAAGQHLTSLAELATCASLQPVQAKFRASLVQTLVFAELAACL